MSENEKPKKPEKKAAKKPPKKLKATIDLQHISDLLADDEVEINLANGQKIVLELAEVGPDDEDPAEAIEKSIANILNDIADMDDDDYEDEDELDEDAETDFDEDDDSDEE